MIYDACQVCTQTPPRHSCYQHDMRRDKRCGNCRNHFETYTAWKRSHNGHAFK